MERVHHISLIQPDQMLLSVQIINSKKNFLSRQTGSPFYQAFL
jgi:hypothetical protein